MLIVRFKKNKKNKGNSVDVIHFREKYDEEVIYFGEGGVFVFES